MVNRYILKQYNNEIKTEISYYDNDRVKDIIVNDSSQQVIASYSSEYNSLGQLVKVTDKDGNSYNYSYDNARQLIREYEKTSIANNIYSRYYYYDAAGNRYSENRDGIILSYAFNDANQVLSRSHSNGNINYSYDDNGNRTRAISSLSGMRTYTYDYANRLISETTSSLQAQYTYNGQGQRTSVNINGDIVEYIYDGMVPVLKRDPAGNVLDVAIRTPNAPGGIGGLLYSYSATDTNYYHNDLLGNVTLITDAGGNVVQTYDYDAFATSSLKPALRIMITNTRARNIYRIAGWCILGQGIMM